MPGSCYHATDVPRPMRNKVVVSAHFLVSRCLYYKAEQIRGGDNAKPLVAKKGGSASYRGQNTACSWCDGELLNINENVKHGKCKVIFSNGEYCPRMLLLSIIKPVNRQWESRIFIHSDKKPKAEISKKYSVVVVLPLSLDGVLHLY